MFLVFNKQKICTYLITIMIVILLFFIAQGTIIPQDSIDTSSNNTKLLPIYRVKTENKKVALTINCAW